MEPTAHTRNFQLSLAADALRTAADILRNVTPRHSVVTSSDPGLDADRADGSDALSSEHELLEHVRCVVELRNKVISPVARLPDDVLQHVFALCAMENLARPDARMHWNVPEYGSPPARWGRDLLMLSHVCRHWRVLAINSPSLWTCVSLDHEYRTGFEDSAPAPWYGQHMYLPPTLKLRRAAYARMFLTRSESSPLTVCIVLPLYPFAGQPSVGEDILGLANGRIRSLAVRAGDLQLRDNLPALLLANRGVMQELYVVCDAREHIYFGGAEPPASEALNTISSVPNLGLTKISIHCQRMPGSLSRDAHLFNECKSLDLKLEWISWHGHGDLVCFLRCVPNVRRIVLTVDNVGAGAGAPRAEEASAVALTSLEMLSLEAELHIISGVLAGLQAPRLEILHLMTRSSHSQPSPITPSHPGTISTTTGSPHSIMASHVSLEIPPANDYIQELLDCLGHYRPLKQINILGIGPHDFVRMIKKQRCLEIIRYKELGLAGYLGIILAQLHPEQHPNLEDICFSGLHTDADLDDLLRWLQKRAALVGSGSKGFRRLHLDIIGGRSTPARRATEGRIAGIVDEFIIGQTRVDGERVGAVSERGSELPTSVPLRRDYGPSLYLPFPPPPGPFY